MIVFDIEVLGQEMPMSLTKGEILELMSDGLLLDFLEMGIKEL